MKSHILITLLFSIVKFSSAQYLNQIGSSIFGQEEGDVSSQVSINKNGEILAIGSQKNATNGTNSGDVRVFEFTNGDWTQKGQSIYGDAAQDRAGNVQINDQGNILIIGSSQNDGAFKNSGQVRVYKFDNNIWAKLGQTIYGKMENDYLGGNISINGQGNILAISARFNNNDPSDNHGHFRIFELINNVWTPIGSEIQSTGDYTNQGFGVSLNSTGNTIAIGEHAFSGPNEEIGRVKVYKNNNGSWEQIGSNINGSKKFAQFGGSLQLNSTGEFIIIGAPRYEDAILGGDCGLIKVFQYKNNDWILLGDSIIGQSGYEKFGQSVGISPDGQTIVIGAPEANRNKYDNGTMNVFKLINSKWTKVKNEIVGLGNFDNLGSSISLSRDGSHVAVGNPFYLDANGKVDVYKIEDVDTATVEVCSYYTSSSGLANYYEGEYYLDTNQVNGGDSIFMVKINRKINTSVGINTNNLSSQTFNANYKWLDCQNNLSEISNSNTRLFEPNNQGSYAVEISLDGCIDTSGCSNFSVGTGYITNKTLNIYPNPTSGVLNIENTFSQDVEIKILDLFGKEIKSEHFYTSKEISLSLNYLIEGLYIIEIISGEERYTSKFIYKK